MSETTDDIRAALAEPFDPKVIGWKPQSAKGNRALAVAYIDARDVMDRLDAVLGVGGWEDEYQPLGDGNVMCRLTVHLPDGRRVVKSDVGGPSDQPDGGDRTKAAFSDALKRTAIKLGVGRYLYSLPAVWCDYDPQKKQFVGTPQLPLWAVPKGQQQQHRRQQPPQPQPQPNTPQPAAPAKQTPPPSQTVGELWRRMSGRSVPATGAELLAWLASVDGSLVKLLGQEYTSGGLAESVVLFLKRKVPADLAELKPHELESGWNSAKQYVKGLETAPAKEVAK